MRDTVATTVTARVQRSTYASNALIFTVAMSVLTLLIAVPGGPGGNAWGLGVFALIGLGEWLRVRGRGLWTVAIHPDGTITSTLRSVQMNYTLRTSVNLANTTAASAGPMTVRVSDASACGTLIHAPVLTLSAAEEAVVVPLSMLEDNPGLMAALRTHTLSNPLLASAPATTDAQRAGRVLVGSR